MRYKKQGVLYIWKGSTFKGLTFERVPRPGYMKIKIPGHFKNFPGLADNGKWQSVILIYLCISKCMF